ncbi:hypothetical protein QJS10_CPA09g00985 [Acorus calamus]|uniref:Uncharacterized protein n=1 Tax=Acorus calamus TaxID=4465 RepID=A0AAV9E4X4_ACOCL|nr:hypothetical protein QJS10_CPA09g00985 [Acorus calamus]
MQVDCALPICAMKEKNKTLTNFLSSEQFYISKIEEEENLRKERDKANRKFHCST